MTHRIRRTMSHRRGGLTLIEGALLVVGIVTATQVGFSMHRWLWAQTELIRYRAQMREVTAVVRAMRFLPAATHETAELRVDTVRQCLQVVRVSEEPSGRIETVERMLWLLDGLSIIEAPALMIWSRGDSPTGHHIVVAAPAYERLFRIRMTSHGTVKLDEEPTS